MSMVDRQQDLLEKSRWMIRVRFVAAAVILIFFAICRAMEWLRFPFMPFAVAPLLEMFVNQPYPGLLKNSRRLERVFTLNLALDVLLITWGLHFLGGMNMFPAVLVYPLVFIYAGIVLWSGMAYFMANFAFICYAGMVFLEYYGIIPVISSIQISIPDNIRLVFVLQLLPFYNLIAFFASFLSGILHKKTFELQQLHMRFVQSQKLASIGQLATGVAHEINNPLFVILGRAEMLSSENPEEVKNTCKVIIEQADRIKTITQRLLAFSRNKKFEPKPVNMNEMLEKSLALLAYQTKMDDIKIIKDFSGKLPVISADELHLQEVFLNVMLNAVQAMEKGGTLTIRTRVARVTKDGRRKTDNFRLGMGLVLIEFEDTGEGMGTEALSKVFEPFFSTKERGTGLGLYICYRIIEEHRGSIEIYSETGKGSKVIIKLPIPKSSGREPLK